MNNYPLPRQIPKPWERGNFDPLPLPLPKTGPSQAITPDFSKYKYLSDAVPLGRNTQGNAISVGTTPTLLLKESYNRPVLILNTAFQTGIGTGVGTAATALSANVLASTTTQATPINVASYDLMHLFLTITGIAGTWDIYAQAQDSITSNWYDAQKVFGPLTAIGDSGYSTFGPVGMAENLAFRFNAVAAGNINCTLSYLIKGSSGSGLVASIGVAYIGTGGSINTVSGYPILAGSSKVFILEEGTELWAVSDQSITVKTFLL